MPNRPRSVRASPYASKKDPEEVGGHGRRRGSRCRGFGLLQPSGMGLIPAVFRERRHRPTRTPTAPCMPDATRLRQVVLSQDPEPTSRRMIRLPGILHRRRPCSTGPGHDEASVEHGDIVVKGEAQFRLIGSFYERYLQRAHCIPFLLPTSGENESPNRPSRRGTTVVQANVRSLLYNRHASHASLSFLSPFSATSVCQSSVVSCSAPSVPLGIRDRRSRAIFYAHVVSWVLYRQVQDRDLLFQPPGGDHLGTGNRRTGLSAGNTASRPVARSFPIGDTGVAGSFGGESLTTSRHGRAVEDHQGRPLVRNRPLSVSHFHLNHIYYYSAYT